jgi:hypothetical protein
VILAGLPIAEIILGFAKCLWICLKLTICVGSPKIYDVCGVAKYLLSLRGCQKFMIYAGLPNADGRFSGKDVD